MLASTVQFSRNGRPPTPTGAYHTTTTDQGDSQRVAVRPHAGVQGRINRPEGQAQRPSLQDPTTCQAPTPPRPRSTALDEPGACTSAPRRCRRQLIDVPPLSTRCPTLGDRPGSGSLARPALLRKEVIQPHLPVRLPCYDLVPIASPTFDSSLPQGVGPPASGVTDFRDLTGGVYKARERIHRSVADLRLLATPTSWGRVADPNPN